MGLIDWRLDDVAASFYLGFRSSFPILNLSLAMPLTTI